MRYGLLLILLLIVFPISSLSTQAINQEGSVAISTNGTIAYSLTVYRQDSNDGLSDDQISNASVIAANLNMYTSWYYPEHGETVQLIHQINPNIKCLLYRNMRMIYNSSDEWQTALENGWLLQDINGDLIQSTSWPENYLVDVGNQEYRDFIAQWLNYYFDLYGFDGVFADCCLSSLAQEHFWGLTSQPVNPRTGQFFTDEEVVTELISFINHVKARIQNKLWISNGIFNGKRFFQRQINYVRILTESSIDGFMSEGLFNWEEHYSEDQWRLSLDFVVWLQNNFLTHPSKVFFPHSRCRVNNLPPNCTQKQMTTFVFTSLLLGISKSQNYLSLQEEELIHEVSDLFEIDLGLPIGDYHILQNTRIYVRDFTKTKVLVNPTDQVFAINLDRTYETIDGLTVSQIIMEPHTGILLKNIQD